MLIHVLPAYILYKNGENGVFTCAYYTIAYGENFAKNVGQYDNSGNHWTIGMSNGYYLDGYYAGRLN